MSEPLLVLGVLLCVWLWFKGLRAREQALAYCRTVCLDRGVQLLDDTVALCRLRILWRRGGLSLQRVYCFEFSPDGAQRLLGRLELQGSTPQGIWLEIPDQPPGLISRP